MTMSMYNNIFIYTLHRAFLSLSSRPHSAFMMLLPGLQSLSLSLCVLDVGVWLCVHVLKISNILYLSFKRNVSPHIRILKIDVLLYYFSPPVHDVMWKLVLFFFILSSFPSFLVPSFPFRLSSFSKLNRHNL